MIKSISTKIALVLCIVFTALALVGCASTMLYTRTGNLAAELDAERAQEAAILAGQQSGAQPAQPGTTAQTGVTTPAKPKVKPKINHGPYEAINEKAMVAFRGLTTDGEPNSCWILIDSNTDQKGMKATDIQYTFRNKEQGELRFVNTASENSVIYTVAFPQVDAESMVSDFNNWVFQTGVSVQKNEASRFPNTYLVSFAQSGEIPFDVIYTVLMEKPKTLYRFYKEESTDSYLLVTEVTTDDKGYATFTTKDLTSFVVSETDIVAVLDKEKAEAEALKKEQARLEEEKRAAELKEKQEAEEKALLLEKQKALEVENTKNEKTRFIIIGISFGFLLVLISLISIKAWKKRTSVK